jgi:ABC-type transport system involved in multi-copper enzyme maturation permease subunit
MTAAMAVTRQQLRALSRSGTVALMLSVLLAMTTLSGLIGWSSHATILRVYDETVRTLAAAGKTAPPNPFAHVPRLRLLNNMIIYVPLIGALLAIIVGHRAITDDRLSGVTRIIFSRPVPRSSYLGGKLAASVLAIATIMAACGVLSAVALTLINHGRPTAGETVRLAAFYAVSGFYLLAFVLVGMVAALLTRSQSMALFISVAVWVLVTFATPQFTSGLRPVASLNPVTDPVRTSQSPFFQLTSEAEPIAITVQYKALTARILTEGSSADPARTAGQLAPLLALVLLLTGATAVLVGRLDASEEAPRD